MFLCDRCGLCCMHLKSSGVSEKLDRGDGICRYLNEKTKLCTIYDKRPIFCNVDRYYDEYISNKISRDEFYALNYLSCKTIKERFG